MSDRFTHLLAARLGIEEDDARQMLAVFNGFLFEELERSGVAVIPEVGAFTRDGDATVFEPDAALTALVNVRHAGLDPLPAVVHAYDDDLGPEEPVEEASAAVIPPEDFVLPGEDVEDAEEDEGVAGWQDEIERPDEAEPEAVEEIADETAVSPDGAPLLEPEPEAETLPTHAEESRALEPTDEGTEDLAEAATAAAETPPSDFQHEEDVDMTSRDETPSDRELAEEERVVEEPATKEAAPAAGASAAAAASASPSDSSPPSSDRPPSPRRRSPVPWIAGIVGVLVLAMVGLFFLLSGDEPRREAEPIVESLPVPPAEAEEEDLGTEEPVDEPVVEEPEPEPAPAAPADPLYGDTIDRSQSRYTLVIASLPSQGAAETVMNSWRNRGFRAAVFAETIEGVTRYRVGVGQFDTIDSADSVRSQSAVASDLPEGTWVYRYPASS